MVMVRFQPLGVGNYPPRRDVGSAELIVGTQITLVAPLSARLGLRQMEATNRLGPTARWVTISRDLPTYQLHSTP